MAIWTKNDLLKRHLPHRLNVLRGFRNRSNLESIEAHCAMKDGAMVTCRVLWSLMGVTVKSTNEMTPSAPTVTPDFKAFESQGINPVKLPAGVNVNSFSKAQFDVLQFSKEIILVLVAANKCVAHIDEDPDHGVSKEILDKVIDTTITEINSRIF